MQDAVRIWSIITYEKSKSVNPDILSKLQMYSVVRDGVVKENPGIMPKDGKLFYRVPTDNTIFMEKYGDEISDVIEKYDVIENLSESKTNVDKGISGAVRNRELIYVHYVPSIVDAEDFKTVKMYEIISNGDGTYNLVLNPGNSGKYDDKLLAYDVSNCPELLEKYKDTVGENGERVIISIPISDIYEKESSFKQSGKTI